MTCTTNRATGSPAATASSACFALSLAADPVSFHSRHPVAANQVWHIKVVMSTADMGSHTSGPERHGRLHNNCKWLSRRKEAACVSAPQLVKRNGTRTASPSGNHHRARPPRTSFYVIPPLDAASVCWRTNPLTNLLSPPRYLPDPHYTSLPLLSLLS